VNITQEHKTLITDEFEEVGELLKNAKGPNDFLYLFSASYGIINRIMNIQCDPMLVFMHQSLQALHLAMQARLQAAGSNPIEPFPFPIELLPKMAEMLANLRLAIIKGSEPEIYRELSRASNLAYASTGNGYYLYIRKKLQI
jgi:hypothetical protein